MQHTIGSSALQHRVCALHHGALCRRQARRTLALQPWQRKRLASIDASAAEGEGVGGPVPDDGVDDDSPPDIGDWRAFRSRMLASAGAEPSDTSRHTPENMALFRKQTQYLADEGIWAQGSDTLQPGSLLIATRDAYLITNDARLAELVLLVLRHDERGSEAIILNRPCTAGVGDLLGWGWVLGAASGPVVEAFATSPVYLGGMFPPNRIVRQKALMLHGQADLRGSTEVSPGVYVGGEQAAAVRVLQGSATTMEYRFFAGSMQWQPQQLEREVDRGTWFHATCSRSVVLKHCLQLPVPLWREVHRLLGTPVE